MSEPEILSIEEVRRITKACRRQGGIPHPASLVLSLCATVDSWHRTAALRHEAMTAAAEELDRLRALVADLRGIVEWQTTAIEVMAEPAEAILDRVVEELRLLREWEASYLRASTFPAESSAEAWAALRAFREGQK